jgi:hypothetical protein
MEGTCQLDRITSGIIPIMLWKRGGIEVKKSRGLQRQEFTSYPTILTPDNEFEFNSDRRVLPICPSTSGVIVHVGYVESLFCGSFCVQYTQL